MTLGISELNAQPRFPLAVGNEWHFTITHVYPPPAIPPEHYYVKVIGDTLMPNGQQYWILDNADMFHGRYIRSDSGYIYYWNYNGFDSSWYELKLFNLQAPYGTQDTIRLGGFFYVNAGGSSPDYLFGTSTTLRSFGLWGIEFAGLLFADEFGYTQYQYDADWGELSDLWELQGCIISGTIYGNMTGVISNPDPRRTMNLMQNYPNPFNGMTELRFSLPTTGHVTLSIYGVLGNLISELVNEIKPAGTYTAYFQPFDLPSGVYYARLSTTISTQTMKILYIK